MLTLRTSDELIRVQIDSSKSLIKYNLFIDEINRFNFRFHGDLLKQTKTHILALQGAIVFKYTGIISRHRLILLLTRDANNSIVPTFK